MKKLLKIRAHHLNCIPRFYRGGYNSDFADNMKSICNRIRKNPDIKIKLLVGELDELCMKCPHRYKKQCVQSKNIGKWVIFQDKKVVKLLRLKKNLICNARKILNIAMNRVNNKKIISVCKGCIFLKNCVKVGINNSFREDFGVGGEEGQG